MTLSSSKTGCPFVQTVSNQIYPTEMYICNSPSWQGREHAPSVGSLMAHCLEGCDYRSCPYYRRVKREQSGDRGGLWGRR